LRTEEYKNGDLSTDFLKRYGILDRLTADIKSDKDANKEAALAAAIIHSEYFKSRVKTSTENKTRWKSQLD
jgi:acetyl-CoA/propionyl-CoA carboxylase